MIESSRPRVLLVSPHPDDESIYFGGTVAKEAQQSDMYIAVLTDGAAGNTTLYEHEGVPARDENGKIKRRPIEEHERGRFIEQRKEELHCAAAILGVPDQNVIFMGIPDQGLNERYIPDVRDVIKDVNPHVVLSFSEAGTSDPKRTDHSWSSIITYKAILDMLHDYVGPVVPGMSRILSDQPAFAFRRYLTSTIPDIDSRFNGKWAELNVPEAELLSVDVSQYMQAKREAMLAHSTQFYLIEFFINGAGLADLESERWFQRIGLSLGVPPRISDVSEAIADQVNQMHIHSYPLSPANYISSDSQFYPELRMRVQAAGL